MIELITILFFGYAGRVWGGWNPYGDTFIVRYFEPLGWEPVDLHRKIMMFTYGFVAGYHLTQDWKVATAVSFLWYAGEREGWRDLFNELSDKIPEQPHLFFRFMFRGFIWPLPSMLILPIQYFFFDHVDWNLLLLFSMTIAFPFSAYFGYKVQNLINKHEFTEWTRGLIFGMFIVLGDY